MLVADGIIRMRYNRSNRRQEFMRKGFVHHTDIDLWSTSIVFNKGHRIRVAVSSSNYPRFDVNPNTGAPWRSDEEPVTACNKIYVGSRFSSYITLPIVGKSPLFD
jgi:hypothetical protein